MSRGDFGWQRGTDSGMTQAQIGGISPFFIVRDAPVALFFGRPR
jgi:hypothetical protein